MENPIKMDDLEVPLFLETSMFLQFFRVGNQVMTWQTPE